MITRILSTVVYWQHEADIPSITRLRSYKFARLVMKNEAVMWWLCA